MAPNEEYSQRLAEREAHLARLDSLNARIESARLSVGASFLIIAGFSFGPASIPRWWLLIPVLAFIAKSFPSNIRELEGALIRVIAYASLTRALIDVPLAAELRLMATWLGLDDIEVKPRGDLAPALRRIYS